MKEAQRNDNCFRRCTLDLFSGLVHFIFYIFSNQSSFQNLTNFLVKYILVFAVIWYRKCHIVKIDTFLCNVHGCLPKSKMVVREHPYSIRDISTFLQLSKMPTLSQNTHATFLIWLVKDRWDLPVFHPIDSLQQLRIVNPLDKKMVDSAYVHL